MKTTILLVAVAVVLVVGIVLVQTGEQPMANQQEEDQPGTLTDGGDLNDDSTENDTPMVNGGSSTPEDDTMTNEDNDTTVNDDNPVVLVRYTDNGFEPATVTVNQGTTVTFQNDSSRSMWPASAQHPTHTVYDGTSLQEHCNNGDAPFDSCEALGSGGTFSFTFDKTGEWGYHNHVLASHWGRIIVE